MSVKEARQSAAAVMRYRPIGAAALLRNNLLVYGLGGLVVPFIGIKAIDLLLVVPGIT